MGFKKTITVLLVLILGPIALADSLSTSTIKLDNAPMIDRKWTGEWQLGTGGGGFDEGKDEGAYAVGRFDIKFNYQFAPWLKAKFHPRLDLYTSRVQARYDDDLTDSGVRLLEGYLAVQPVDFAEARAGAISQDYLNSPMLVTKKRAFPGFQEVVGSNFSNQHQEFGIHFVAEQVVPTSYTMDTEREDKEALPTFNVQSIHLDGKHFDKFEWKLWAGHYNWSNIPDKVAYWSGMEGNSSIGDTPANSQLSANFDGLFGGLEACACIADAPIQFVGEFQRVHNDRADSILADAQMWGVGPRIHFGQRTLDIRYRRYFIEKDASVAVYTPTAFGHTNRIGDNIEARLDLPDLGFAVRGAWTNALPLRDNDVQMTMTFLYLGVETNYAPF